MSEQRYEWKHPLTGQLLFCERFDWSCTRSEMAAELLRLSAALAVAEGERLRLAIALREVPKYRVDGSTRVPIDEDWMATFRKEIRLAIRLTDEEGSENGQS